MTECSLGRRGSVSSHRHSPSLRETRAGTRGGRESSRAGARNRDLEHCLLPCSRAMFATFLSQLWLTCLGMVLSTMDCALLHPLTIKKVPHGRAPQASLTEALLYWRLLLHRRCQVDNQDAPSQLDPGITECKELMF